MLLSLLFFAAQAWQACGGPATDRTDYTCDPRPAATKSEAKWVVKNSKKLLKAMDVIDPTPHPPVRYFIRPYATDHTPLGGVKTPSGEPI